MTETWAHVLVSSLHLFEVLVFTLGRVSMSRQLGHFSLLYRFTISSAAILVPTNLACVATPEGTVHQLVFSVSVATVSCIAIMAWACRHRRDDAGKPRTVLAIGAHPDDLELACSATLARLVDEGHQVHALVMTHGAVGGDAAVRPDEARRGATYLGLTSVEVHDLPDTHLEDHSSEMIQIIETAIQRHDPHLLLTHSRHDQHQDHVAVHWATCRAGRNHPAILCFESPSVTSEFLPTVFTDVAEYLDAKQMAVALHANQSDKPYMADAVLQGAATFRGRQARLEQAEGFEVIRLPLFRGIL